MPEERPWNGRALHFVGVGGAGMSGWAHVAAQLGATVTGSDRAASPALERLAAEGLAVVAGHDAANVPAGEHVELIVSTAVPADNPEVVVARERGLVVLANFYGKRKRRLRGNAKFCAGSEVELQVKHHRLRCILRMKVQRENHALFVTDRSLPAAVDDALWGRIEYFHAGDIL